MTSKPVPVLLQDLLVHAERARSIRASFRERRAFVADRTACDAVLWNFVVIGEVCGRLGKDFQQAHPDIPWKLIIGQRNLIAHGYDVLNWERLAETIERELPVLIEAIQRLVATYGPPHETRNP